jgi:putative ABC transport system substrate-binding protein
MAPARSTAQIEAAFVTMRSQGVDEVLVPRDALFFGEKVRIATLAANSQLPTMGGYGEAAEAGGFIAYGASIPHAYRQAARYVDRILKGANPADLPIEQPTKFELVINLKTAKALGLTIPPSLLLRADQVIE